MSLKRRQEWTARQKRLAAAAAKHRRRAERLAVVGWCLAVGLSVCAASLFVQRLLAVGLFPEVLPW